MGPDGVDIGSSYEQSKNLDGYWYCPSSFDEAKEAYCYGRRREQREERDLYLPSRPDR